ncbi:MAG: murein biosynthesis integral membrane protein MurJ [Gammaproteobacteria bacterium RIFCSPHIGHO2_12_FULL_37_14]|nr:MAG: murein biosynthesis integral membrane protein MurJ [Gammaproteobacteria bacterium RIFCSPHIGHO2_12_FULL_37_14]
MGADVVVEKPFMKRENLLGSTVLVSINRIISLSFGYTRDMIWACVFGSSLAFDAFVIAFHLPSFFSYIISEAGIRQVFIPLLSEKQIQSTDADVKTFISDISLILLIVLVVVVIISIGMAPVIIKMFAPGLCKVEKSFILAVSLFRIMAVGILFTSLSELFGAILNTFGSYGIPSSTPIIFNVVAILSTSYFTDYFKIPIYALAFGILASGIFQGLIQIPFLKRKNLLVKPSPRINVVLIRKVFKMVIPTLAGVSIMQLGVLIDFIFSSYLPKGSITWLYYSTRLMEIPVGIFSIAIAAVALPNLGRYYAKKDMDSYNQVLDGSIRNTLFFGMPASAGLFVLSGPIIATLFKHGIFSSNDVIMATSSTKAFAIGICGFMLIKACAVASYARQDAKLPAKIAAIGLLCNIVFNFIFFKQLMHAGLALATSLAGIVNAGILFSCLITKKYYQPEAGFWLYTIKLMIATLTMLLVLLHMTPTLSAWLNAGTIWRILHLSMLILLGAMTYILSMDLLGCRIKKFSLGLKME